MIVGYSREEKKMVKDKEGIWNGVDLEMGKDERDEAKENDNDGGKERGKTNTTRETTKMTMTKMELTAEANEKQTKPIISAARTAKETWRIFFEFGNDDENEDNEGEMNVGKNELFATPNLDNKGNDDDAGSDDDDDDDAQCGVDNEVNEGDGESSLFQFCFNKFDDNIYDSWRY